ncbi:hypothetical protein SLS62_009134 [Diatrype stigma]|uniref:Uncharacterized protein n=1 Tax=Diatrype stigma TaxID=117547 RepID=A0AAN9UI15_9PEZI
MEALRSQLKEVQGHLADRDRKYRQLNHEYRTAKDLWTTAKQDYESRIQALEAENQRLRKATALGDEVVTTLTRAQREEVESRFLKTETELISKTKQCETLQKLLESRTPTAITPDITEAQVITLFTTLRERIRHVSMKRFNDSIPMDLIPQKSRDELHQLSSNWESYMGSQMICYLLRALIWRYIYSALFLKPGRIWGQETRALLRAFSGLFASPKVSHAEYQGWRVATGRLLHKAGKFDNAVLDEVRLQIYEATKHFATGGGRNADQELKNSIHEIVTIGGQLSDAFTRSCCEPLMSDKPGSVLTRDFPFAEETMEIKAKMRTQVPAAVDMVISPCLLKNDSNYKVLVKAEVVC